MLNPCHTQLLALQFSSGPDLGSRPNKRIDTTPPGLSLLRGGHRIQDMSDRSLFLQQ